jgi:ribosomal protein L16 Arg81 hydroxylase
MNTPNTLELIVERAERLLVRHEEIQRTNALLASELKQVRAERDLLKTRMEDAKARLDALLAQLPPEARAEAATDQEVKG